MFVNRFVGKLDAITDLVGGLRSRWFKVAWLRTEEGEIQLAVPLIKCEVNDPDRFSHWRGAWYKLAPADWMS